MSGYLQFTHTGVPEIDGILERIELAGDAYHHTSDWCEQAEWYEPKGKSYIEMIQEAANKAALVFKSKV